MTKLFTRMSGIRVAVRMPLMPSITRALKLFGSLCTPKPTSLCRERVHPTRARKRSSLNMQIAFRKRMPTRDVSRASGRTQSPTDGD